MASCAMTIGGVMAEGEDWRDRFEAEVREKDGHKLPYRLATLGEGEALPLVVFLHGAGERGDDNEAQLKHGMKDLLAWCDREKQACLILAPQCANDVWWSDYEGDYKNPKTLKFLPEPSPRMALVFEVIDALIKDGAVDTKRIYITGLSMGGYGTFDAISQRPNFFAAAMPICGGGDSTQAKKFKDLPLWVFHGSKDDIVPPEMSRAMVEAVKKAGGKAQYREYPEAGHDSWTATYCDEEVLQWLFEQSRE